MIKLIKNEYNKKMYIVGKKIICDICMKTIYDSRDDESSEMYYLAALHQTENDDGKENYYHMCGTECVRKLFDGFLSRSKRSIQPGRFDVRAVLPIDRRDYNEPPTDIPVDEYKKLQREAN